MLCMRGLTESPFLRTTPEYYETASSIQQEVWRFRGETGRRGAIYQSWRACHTLSTCTRRPCSICRRARAARHRVTPLCLLQGDRWAPALPEAGGIAAVRVSDVAALSRVFRRSRRALFSAASSRSSGTASDAASTRLLRCAKSGHPRAAARRVTRGGIVLPTPLRSTLISHPRRATLRWTCAPSSSAGFGAGGGQCKDAS